MNTTNHNNINDIHDINDNFCYSFKMVHLMNVYKCYDFLIKIKPNYQ